MTTPRGSKSLHYVTDDLKVISYEQLDVKYNRPDKVLSVMGSSDTALITSYRKAYEKRIKKLKIDTTSFTGSYSVPESDFDRRSIEYEQKSNQMVLKISGLDPVYYLDRFNVWINESPVFGMRGVSLKGRNRNTLDTTIVVQLSDGENQIETSITNINGTESYRMPLHVTYTPEKPDDEKLHFIGIGIDQFAQTGQDLKWSVKDVRDQAQALKVKYGSRVIIDTLFDQQVTVANIALLKKKLQNTTVNDKVIIAYSGHGLLSKDYDYFLSTYNVNFDNPK